MWACISYNMHLDASQIVSRKEVGTLDGIYNIELAIYIVIRNVSGPASSTVGGDLSAIVSDQGSVEPPMSVRSSRQHLPPLRAVFGR